MSIPVIHEIGNLHHATMTLQHNILPDFHIYRNEDANRTCRSSMDIHRCNFSQLSIDRRSAYSLWQNSQKINTADNTIYTVGAGQLISWQATNSAKCWEGYNIIFMHDFLSIGYNPGFRKEFPFLHPDHTAAIPIGLPGNILFDLCEQMLYEQDQDKPDVNILRHYLYALLYSIKRLYLQQIPAAMARQPTREADLASRFEELVSTDRANLRSIRDYAERLFVSPKYLSQVTKNIYGLTAKEMIVKRRIEEAKSLLVQTDLTVNQIAFSLGYNDSPHFIKSFLLMTGQNPTDFRRKQQILP